MMGAKIFRDPLYDYISIDRQRDGWLLELLDCPEVQRLRRVHQLGLSNLTYPGAEHSRLSHSLGVIHLTLLALEHLASECPSACTEEARQSLLAAALLHDVGHGPFSHVAEVCLGVDHEEWSCRVVGDPETHVHRLLKRVNAALPERVVGLVGGESRAPLWQKSLLSGQLDVDRLDYLRRDSLFTGAGYGHFDWFRLLHTFTLHGSGDRDRELVWTDKALYAIEEYVFARYYMYRNVYLHKTTRGFERMLQAAWALAARLRAAGDDVRLLRPVAEFWGRADAGVPQFLAFEEFAVLGQMQEWTNHPHRALNDLAHRFLGRQRFRSVELPPSRNPLEADARCGQALEELAAAHGFEPASAYVLRDDPERASARAYVPEKECDEQQSHNAIRLRLDGHERPVEVSQLLPRLRAVTDEPARQVRYYVLPELYREALALRDRL